jgi:hypothetical protein
MFVNSVYAQCPVCIITVGGGLLLAERLGIDSFLVSIWISALNTAVAYYMATKFKKLIFKNGYFWSILFYILTVFYLDFSNQLKDSNLIFGIDRSLLGLSFGLILSIFSINIDQIIKYINKGKVLFFYQKIIIPLIILITSTLFFKKIL